MGADDRQVFELSFHKKDFHSSYGQTWLKMSLSLDFVLDFVNENRRVLFVCVWLSILVYACSGRLEVGIEWMSSCNAYHPVFLRQGLSVNPAPWWAIQAGW